MSLHDNYLRQEREREVSQERKQRLFHMAGDVALLGDWKREPLKNCLGVEGNFPEVTTVEVTSHGYPDLARISVKAVEMVHRPARIDDETIHPEEVTFVVTNYQDESELYTMKRDVGEESERVTVANSTEMAQRSISGLEVSLYDALKLQMIVTAVIDKIDERLATPYDI